MATTCAANALPTSYGGTVIQANALLVSPGDYEVITLDKARFALSVFGQSHFREFPWAAKQQLPNVDFYRRKDVNSSAAPAATIAMVTRKVDRYPVDIPSAGGVNRYDITAITVEVKMWHVVTLTLDSGDKIVTGVLSKVAHCIVRDPMSPDLVAPTSGYLLPHEAMSFLLKPVAAGAPVWDPFYAAQGGSNPNV